LSTGRTCFVRETGAVEGRPTLLLLHGWLASGGLNWMRAFESLNAHYRVLAPDFRGHARGGPSRTGFSMSESADDMGALLDALNLGGPAIVVGYSMGGMIAQELWRRHRSLVGGLVLSATSCAPVPISRGRTPFARIMNLANATTRKMGSALSIPTRILSTFERGLVEATDDAGTGREASPRAFTAPSMTPSTTPTSRSSDASAASIGTPPTSDWARREFARHHWPTVLDAGRAIAEFDTRDWIREVDVPTTVMLTKRDRLVPPHQQRAMAGRIPDARIETVDAGHFACVRDDFGPRILRSVRSVEKSMA
jgi:pimeloyl-ACP methyl ester carboxylesterase